MRYPGRLPGGTGKGKAAFRRAVTASGITPPDLPGFTWGAGMGSQEAGAWISAAEVLELAIASGELIPGHAGLEDPPAGAGARPPGRAPGGTAGPVACGMITSERAEAWVSRYRSPARQQAAAAVANRLLHPVQLPPQAAADPLPRWRWLLGQLDDGIPLTAAGNLSRAFVQHNAARFGWDLSRPPRAETDLYDLHQLRCLAGDLGIARRSGRVLTLTANGRRMLGDPDHLWRATAAALAGDNFTVFAGELFLAMLAGGGPLPAGQVTATVARAAAEEGFRDSRTGQPPGEHDIAWAISRTANLCRALGLLAPGSDSPGRRYQLTPVGPRPPWKHCALTPPAPGPSPSPATSRTPRRAWHVITRTGGQTVLVRSSRQGRERCQAFVGEFTHAPDPS